MRTVRGSLYNLALSQYSYVTSDVLQAWTARPQSHSKIPVFAGFAVRNCRGSQRKAMMYAIVVAILAFAAEAVLVQPSSAAASTSKYVDVRWGLWQARNVGSNLGRRRDVIDSDGAIGNYAIVGNVNQRQLQHGAHSPGQLIICSACKMHGVTAEGVYRKGHCKANQMRFTCFKLSGGTKAFFADSESLGIPTARTSAVAILRNSTSTPITSRKEEIVMLVKGVGGNTSSVLAGVGCFSNSDCALLANALAPLKGKSPMSRGGVVTAECLGPINEEEVPGICMCAYTDGSANGDAASSTGKAADTASGSGRRTLPKRRAQSFHVKTVAPKFDICLRRASMKSISIVTESTGSARLVNSTATGNNTQNVDLVEVKQNVLQDDVVIGDVEPNALVLSLSAMPFSADEKDEYDDDGPVLVSDADNDSTSPAPAPSLPQRSRTPSPSLGTARIRRKGETNAPVPTPAPAPAVPPGRPLPRKATTAPALAQTPTPAAADDTLMRGRAGGANKRVSISDEFDVTMSF